MKATVTVTAIIAVITVVVLLVSDRGGETERPPAVPAAAKPDPKAGRPSPAVKKRELPKGGNADLLRAIVKAAVEAPPSGEAIDEKALDERLAAIRKDFEARVARIRARSRQYRKPLRGDAEPGNAWDYYRKAIDRYNDLYEHDFEESKALGRVHQNIPDNETSEEKAERLKKAAEVIEKYRDIVDLMRKGSKQAMADDALEYEKGIGEPRMFATGSLGMLQFTRDVGEVLENRKSYDEALMLYADAMRLANDQGTDHGLIGSLIGIMGNGIIGDSTQQLFNHPLDSESLRRFLMESTLLMEQQPTLRDSLDSEIALQEATIIDLVEHTQKISQAFEIEPIIRHLTGLKSPFTKDQLKDIPAIKRVLLDGIEQYAEYVNRVQDSRSTGNWRSLQETLRSLQAQEDAMKKHPVMRIVAPAIALAFVEFYRSEASMRELHLAAAVKLYRQEYGTFPEHLDHLVATGIVPAVPVDPFTGEPFRYVRSEDGSTVTIYSIGENLVDNKGVDHMGGEGNDDVGVTVRTGTKNQE